LDAFREDVRGEFQYLRTVSPPASRDSSSEVYLVAKGLTTAPVETGDRLEVTAEELGDEGDGIAYVEGYSLFISDATVGETLEVVVTDIKPRFGFAERTNSASDGQE
jgi:23S rRNA (uridine2552-2'-O)-methyltransferase